MAGSAIAVTPRPSLTQPLPPVSPWGTEITMWKAGGLQAFFTPHGISPFSWQFLWDCFFLSCFIFFLFLSLWLFNNTETGLPGREMLDWQPEGVPQSARVKFDFLHVHYCCLEHLMPVVRLFLMDQLSILTWSVARNQTDEMWDTCQHLLLAGGNWTDPMTAN